MSYMSNETFSSINNKLNEDAFMTGGFTGEFSMENARTHNLSMISAQYSIFDYSTRDFGLFSSFFRNGDVEMAHDEVDFEKINQDKLRNICLQFNFETKCRRAIVITAKKTSRNPLANCIYEMRMMSGNCGFKMPLKLLRKRFEIARLLHLTPLRSPIQSLN